ncbi:MAG: hypothetical protein QXN55_07295 [Candidatus Nitrosotenuis sp.]
MPAIKIRDEGYTKRSQRLALLKKGPGIFAYNGNGIRKECIPTPLTTGAKIPDLDADGMPKLDDYGRQIFVPAGRHVIDSEGRVVMGGKPKVKNHKIEVFNLWGTDFPTGKPVVVKDIMLARKLRGMDCFEEIEEEIEETESIDNMTWQKIKALAKEKGLTFAPSTTKAEMVEKIKEAIKTEKEETE